MSSRAEALAPNLWRWTTPHPLWRPGDDERAGGWERDVGSVLYARDGTVTIIDPLAGEDDDALWACLATLPRRQRAAVVLRYYEDLTDAEIADTLGCRPASVRAYISKALAALRQLPETQTVRESL